jgi:hypothetical protein
MPMAELILVQLDGFLVILVLFTLTPKKYAKKRRVGYGANQITATA